MKKIDLIVQLAGLEERAVKADAADADILLREILSAVLGYIGAAEITAAVDAIPF